MRRLAAGAAGIMAALAFLVPEAQAGGFIIRSQSAPGFGMSLAGVAAGDELSYSFWNPAVLSQVDGFQVEAGAAAVLPSIDIFSDATGSEIDIGENALVPSSFVAAPLTDQLTVGLAVTSPFGLSTDAPHDWDGQFYSRKSEIFSINASPMISWRVNDKLSIGAGLQFEYFKADLTSAAVLNGPSAELKADDFGVGFNLGMQFRPWDGTTIGLGYRSSIAHDLEGHLTVPGDRSSANATLDTPDVVSLGIVQKVTDRLRLAGTVEWNNWSRLGDVKVEGTDQTLYLEYRDGWLFSVGAEYDVNDKLTLRAGAGYEIVPLTTDNRDTRLPEMDQVMFSVGASYACNDRVTLAVSYLHSMGVGDAKIDIQSDNKRWLGIDYTGTSNLDVNIVSVGVNVKFGG